MTEQYEYVAQVCFVGEYITIHHDSYLESEELIDLDIDWERLVEQADDFIKDYYGFSPKALATVEIEVDWRSYPDGVEE